MSTRGAHSQKHAPPPPSKGSLTSEPRPSARHTYEPPGASPTARAQSPGGSRAHDVPSGVRPPCAQGARRRAGASAAIGEVARPVWSLQGAGSPPGRPLAAQHQQPARSVRSTGRLEGGGGEAPRAAVSSVTGAWALAISRANARCRMPIFGLTTSAVLSCRAARGRACPPYTGAESVQAARGSRAVEGTRRAPRQLTRQPARRVASAAMAVRAAARRSLSRARGYASASAAQPQPVAEGVACTVDGREVRGGPTRRESASFSLPRQPFLPCSTPLTRLPSPVAARAPPDALSPPPNSVCPPR